jgi:hypothetical protein
MGRAGGLSRVVASLIEASGVHLGVDLNEAKDNLWFTLLFKRIEVLDCHDREFDQLTRILVAGIQGARPLTRADIELVDAVAAHDRPQHASAWLRERADSLNAASRRLSKNERWGWKEPNTHIVIERLWKRIPELRYIHVVRHGLDMAYSRNQNQLQLWGESVLGANGPLTPARSLAYWCRVHRRMQRLQADHPDRVYWLDYDALCREPMEHLPPLLAFVGLSTQGDLQRLAEQVQPSMRTPRIHDPIDGFLPLDLAFVRSLGYHVDDALFQRP